MFIIQPPLCAEHDDSVEALRSFREDLVRRRLGVLRETSS